MKITVFWDIAPCSLIEVDMFQMFILPPWSRWWVMMETVHTSETSVNFYETTHSNIPEDCHLQFTVNQSSIRITFF
jgi:hypothetical protein